MKSMGRSLRRKLLGETWTIPLGVASAVAIGLVARALLPHGDWQSVGGFALAALLIATLVRSLSTDRSRAEHHRRSATEPHQPTTTRREQ